MRQKMKNNPLARGPRNLLVVVGIFLTALFVLTWLTDYTRHIKTIPYSTLMQMVETDQVKSVHISGQDLYGIAKDGSRFESVIAENPGNWDLLRKHNVEFSVAPISNQFNGWHIIILVFLLLIPLALWYFMRQMRSGSGNGGIFNIGKSRARLIMPAMINERFSDVAGAKEAKEELQDLIDFLKNPEKYRKLGAKIPRGVLLVGEPGNGKTLLAKAVAGEANCPFFSITGSDFIEVFVGVGAARVRDLFAKARQHAPAIVFIDEIDAIGRQRGNGGFGGGHDEREQTLNQLLTEMDGFETSPVIVIAATNMPEVLDKALLRPGRFDRRVVVPFPDTESRLKILKIHTNSVKYASDVNFEYLAQETAGFSGADLGNLVNKAALFASKRNHSEITMQDFNDAHKAILQANNEHNNQMSSNVGLGNSLAKPKIFMPMQIKVKFDDVAGLPEAKEDLKEVVDFLRDPEKYKRLGAQMNKGILLVGEPGNGKTLLAKAVAGEANCPFFSVSGSDFVEQFVGVGAARVRDLFANARRHQPSIIFIDEVDAVGVKRSEYSSGGHDESAQTLNQLLTELDGFNSIDTSVIVMAATNRPDMLDAALLRPGRLGKRVHVSYPRISAREQILRTHLKKIKFDPALDIAKLAQSTIGFSGADLAQLVNEAALIATKDNKEIVSMIDFDKARDRIIMGKAQKSIILTPEERRMVAYHEAGHTLIRLLKPESADPLYKVTIIPHDGNLGSSHFLPKGDDALQTKDQIEAEIASALGGRAAEVLIFSKLSSGAGGDFIKATDYARKMACIYGMTEELGPVVYNQGHGQFQYSQQTASKIDGVVQGILQNIQKEVMELLVQHRQKLETLAQALLEKETLFAEEIYELLGITPRQSGRLVEDTKDKQPASA